MNLRHLKRPAAILAAAAVLGVAGCGSDTPESTNTANTGTAAETTTTAPTTAATTTPERPAETTEPETGTTQPGTTQPGTTQPGTTQPGTTQPGTTQPGTTSPGASGSFTGSTNQQQVGADDETFLSVTAIRTATHDGYDRVVYELDGEGGRPGYDVRYVPAAIADGAGNAVAVPGGSILEVRISGWGYPFDTGAAEYSGPREIAGPGPAVAGVVLGSSFEGIAQSFIGVNGEPRPFTVARLDGPRRIVIDIAH